MSTTVPTFEPARFAQGDIVTWTKALSNYLPADGYTLHYAFVKDGEAAIVADGTDNGDGAHRITMDATKSASFAVGGWRWQAYVTKGSPVVTERTTLFWGDIAVDPDFATQTTGYDGRSIPQKLLDLAEAKLLECVTQRFPVAGYSFSTGQGSRAVTIRSYEELLKFRNRMKTEVAREAQAQRIAQGLGTGRRMRVRFTGPQ